jgi:hypothetical protein
MGRARSARLKSTPNRLRCRRSTDIIVVTIFFTASYKRERSFTWLTGVLLLITLLLSFRGYLLPWDQLAYWAVTIGASMAASVLLAGEQLNLLLRGSESIGADGLLRFHQLHVIVLPLAAIVLVSVHYYRVARKHSISLPARVEEGNLSPEARQAATRRVDWLPDLLLHEVFLISIGLLALAALALFAYDAPLERHAHAQPGPGGAHRHGLVDLAHGQVDLGLGGIDGHPLHLAELASSALGDGIGAALQEGSHGVVQRQQERIFLRLAGSRYGGHGDSQSHQSNDKEPVCTHRASPKGGIVRVIRVGIKHPTAVN